MTKVTGLLLLLLISQVVTRAQDSLAENLNPATEQIYLNTRTDVKEVGKIILEWTANPTKRERFFTIERSKDGKEFDVIGVIKGSKEQSRFEFTDEQPSSSNNHYRIKTVISEDKVLYSKIISKGVAAAQFCKFYPNPVEKYLIVRTESPVELKVMDQLNKVRISKQLQVGLQLVDVNSLERGLYIITLYQKESNKLITDKLMKN